MEGKNVGTFNFSVKRTLNFTLTDGKGRNDIAVVKVLVSRQQVVLVLLAESLLIIIDVIIVYSLPCSESLSLFTFFWFSLPS